MVFRMRTLWLVGLVAFFLNPAFACIAEQEFQYGEKEMRAAVEGTWQANLTFSDGRQSTVTFALKQGAGTAMSGVRQEPEPGRGRLVRPANACDDRTFVKSAGACISQSRMPVEGTFVAGDDAYRAVAITGELVVRSLSFFGGAGQLTIRFGQDILTVQNLSPDGQAMNVQLQHPAVADGGVSGSATLVRTMP